MRRKGNAEELEARRMRAAELFRQGLGPTAVGRMLGVAHSSASRWKKALDEDGVEGLKSKPHPGREPFLSAKDKKRLLRLLLRGAPKAGYPNELWSCERVADLIEREFGVSYHPGWVWQILRDLGWSSQKPERRARERDEAAIAKWRTEDWPRIKKELCAAS
jgi:transposase